MTRWSSLRRCVVLLRRRRDRHRRRDDRRLVAPARHPARLGHGAARPASSAGGSRRSSRSASRDWDWGADGLVAPHARHRHPGHDGGRGHARPARAPGFAARWASGPASSSRRDRCARSADAIAVLRRYRELVRLARREGFGPLLSRRRRAERSVDGAVCGCGACSRRPAASTSSSGRSPRPASTSCRPRSAPSWRSCRTGSRRSRSSEIAAGARGRARRRRRRRSSPSSTGSRSPRRRSARPTARGCASGEPVVVKVQRPGIEDVIERDLAALALLADLAQRRTDVRSGRPLGRDARPVRARACAPSSTSAARPTRWRRWRMLLGPRSSVRIPKVYSELCTRRLLVQERFDGFTRRRHRRSSRRPASTAERSPRSCCAPTLEQVLGVGFFHADPHPGNIFAFADGTLGLIDFGAVGRLDPIQQAAVVDILAALVRRDVSLLRDGIERVADGHRGGVAGAARAGARAADGRPRPRRRARSTHPCCRTWSRRCSTFGIRLPGRARHPVARARHPRRARCASSRPALSLVAAATEMMTSTDAPARSIREAMLRDELLAALPHLRRLPDRIDRILTLTGRGDLRIRHVDGRGRPAHRCARSSTARCSPPSARRSSSRRRCCSSRPNAGPHGRRAARACSRSSATAGCSIGTVLLLRVVAAVARDGTT